MTILPNASLGHSKHSCEEWRRARDHSGWVTQTGAILYHIHRVGTRSVFIKTLWVFAAAACARARGVPEVAARPGRSRPHDGDPHPTRGTTMRVPMREYQCESTNARVPTRRSTNARDGGTTPVEDCFNQPETQNHSRVLRCTTCVPTYFSYSIEVNHARATQVSASVEESIQESASGAQTPVVGKGAHECDATALSQTHLQGCRLPKKLIVGARSVESCFSWSI